MLTQKKIRLNNFYYTEASHIRASKHVSGAGIWETLIFPDRGGEFFLCSFL